MVPRVGNLSSSALTHPPLIPAEPVTCLGSQGKDPELAYSGLGQASGVPRSETKSWGQVPISSFPGSLTVESESSKACLELSALHPDRLPQPPEDGPFPMPQLSLTAGCRGRTGSASISSTMAPSTLPKN